MSLPPFPGMGTASWPSLRHRADGTVRIMEAMPRRSGPPCWPGEYAALPHRGLRQNHAPIVTCRGAGLQSELRRACPGQRSTPPLARMISPLIVVLAAEATNTITEATSSGVGT